MKVLYLDNLGADYGSYLLYHGLVGLLGAENVILWPYKRTFSGGVDCYPDRISDGKWTVGLEHATLWVDESLWRAWARPQDFPNAKVAHDGACHFYEPIPSREWTYEEIEAGLRAGDFSLAILASPRWFNSAALHELQAKLGKFLPPLVMYDAEDYEDIRADFIAQFKPQCYFKRTMIQGVARKVNPICPVFPLPFGSMWNIPWTPWITRTTDIFCVFGMTQVMRPKVRAIVEDIGTKFNLRIRTAIGHPMGHKEYLAALAQSKIVIDHQGRGSDTVRTWESLAAGACTFTDMQLEFPAPLVPDEHFIHYPRDEHYAGATQDLRPFQAKLEAAVQDWPRIERIARAGYDQVRAQHTTIARAQYLLDSAWG